MKDARGQLVVLGVVGLVTALSACSTPGVIAGHGADGGHAGGTGGASGAGGGGGAGGGNGGQSWDGGSSTSPCAPDAGSFEAQVWNRVLATRCAPCHSAGGVASGSRMVYVVPATTPAAMEQNLLAATGMALTTEAGQPLLLRRPTGINHVGGLVLLTDSAEYLALADFTGRIRNAPGACEAQSCKAGDPGPRLLRRLTRAELDTSLHDAFGVSKSSAATLVPDTTVNGFDNSARALTVTPLLADQLRKVAEEAAALVAANPAYACTGDGPTCAKAWLQGPASRVFRRPLTATEVTRWLAVYQVGRETAPSGTPAHQSGMELLLSGLMQSPGFLYRAELGVADTAGGYALTSYEIASELSYFLWGAPPDDTLWALATSDRLRDPATIAAQARRLIASPRARGALDRFTSQWLTLEQLAFLPKDVSLYPELTPALRADMAEEVSRLVASVVQGGGTLSEVLTQKKTSVNASLARFYGISAPATTDSAGFGLVSERAGLLGTGAVLTAHARPNGSSPISRGKLVREQLLCQALPTPPSGVAAQPPAADPSMTTRQRYAAHSAIPECDSCHRLVDPIGWGFEHYDGIGRYRATESTLAIDDSGEVLATLSTNGSFNGIDQLSARLAASSEVASCFALQWARFAYALKENAQTSCLTDEVRQRFVGGTGAIDQLLVDLTQTSQFRRRSSDSPSNDAGADGGSGAGGGGGSGGSGGGTGGGSTPDAGSTDPNLTPEVTVVMATTNQWQTGSCSSITISNPSSHSVAWRVQVTITGTIYDSWNFQILSHSGTSYVITGSGFNASVPPGGTASGGFCVNL